MVEAVRAPTLFHWHMALLEVTFNRESLLADFDVRDLDVGHLEQVFKLLMAKDGWFYLMVMLKRNLKKKERVFLKYNTTWGAWFQGSRASEGLCLLDFFCLSFRPLFHQGKYDFFYLPIDFQTDNNLGCTMGCQKFDCCQKISTSSLSCHCVSNLLT